MSSTYTKYLKHTEMQMPQGSVSLSVTALWCVCSHSSLPDICRWVCYVQIWRCPTIDPDRITELHTSLGIRHTHRASGWMDGLGLPHSYLLLWLFPIKFVCFSRNDGTSFNFSGIMVRWHQCMLPRNIHSVSVSHKWRSTLQMKCENDRDVFLVCIPGDTACNHRWGSQGVP